MEELPPEEQQELNRIATDLARFTAIMLSQQIESRGKDMDVIAKSYLAQRTFEILLGDTESYDWDD